MIKTKRVIRTLHGAIVGALATCLASGGLANTALAQARQNLAQARVAYSAMKAATRPQGELKEKIDAIDKALAEANHLGKTGEMRRLLAKGVVLLSGREWTDLLDFSTSLVLRTTQVFVDSSRPFSASLGQIYSPSADLSASLAARAWLQTPRRGAQDGEKIKDLGSWDGVSRDLQDDPLYLELDFSDVADGWSAHHRRNNEADPAVCGAWGCR